MISINRVFRGILLVSALSPFAQAQLEHKGPAAAIALSQTVPAFDVSSVKLNNTVEVTSWGMGLHNDGFTADDVPLQAILQFAYDIKSDLISGIPKKVADLHFDIMAKVLPDADGKIPTLSGSQIQAMVIRLFADRFHLKAHLEQKDLPVYDLIVAKGGPKFKLDVSESHTGGWNINGVNTEKVLSGKEASMDDLAAALSDETDRKVIDKTGLLGHADIILKWSDDVAAEQGGANVISIFTAVEEQLGLKLLPSRGPVDTLVIDQAEMPTDN